MKLRSRLLRRLLAENPFQPATSWWRAVELEAVIAHGLPEGIGLDLGCGDGKLMRILLGESTSRVRLIGVDPDPLESREATAAGVYERVHTAAGDRVPEADASFDFVFSNSVLEHIDDLEPVIAEVARVLRPGGTFLFTVPAGGFHDCLAGPLLPWVARSRYLEDIDRRCAHRRYWDEPQWRECLGRHGMTLTSALPYLSAKETQRWETVSRFTAGMLYATAGRRLQPIELQRALGLRRGRDAPGWAVAPVGALLSALVGEDRSARHACLLVAAQRR